MKHETSHHFFHIFARPAGHRRRRRASPGAVRPTGDGFRPALLAFSVGPFRNRQDNRVSSPRNSDQRILAGFYRALVVYFLGAPLGPELRQYLANDCCLLWGESHPENPFQED